MPMETRGLDAGIGSITIGRGDLTDEECVDFYKRFFSQDAKKYKKYRYAISDFSHAKSADISTAAIRKIAEMAIEASTINSDALVAQVADRDLAYGLTRMWQALAHDTKWEIMVFRSMEDARDWVRRRAYEKYDIDLTFE